MRITVLGAGAFGSALGHILEAKKHEVTYFSLASKITLEESLKDAEMIILAIPSKAIDEMLPKLPKNIPLVVATKGILDTSIFKDFEDVMVLSGPGFAADIEKHVKTTLTATDPRIRDLFETPWLKFELTADEKGVLLCGALKNIYAIYAGWHNLKPGTDKYNNFIETVIQEFKLILFYNGANPKTAELLCGRGDLILTCDFPSRNYEFGQGLIAGKTKPAKTVEGVTALKRVKAGELKVPPAAGILRELIRESDAWA
ncbi:hypothetical protein IKP94_01165 [Candidatus Saccharibacteria bacterium]|nr:hypothetical protein [Candidatus Saccharibacteria bacterium]MBR6964901.1 hypothetical protein [Candidatus Saccharibacteria bacterium]